jgi:hypothetical protein
VAYSESIGGNTTCRPVPRGNTPIHAAIQSLNLISTLSVTTHEPARRSSWTAARLLGRLRSALFGVADENKDVESTHRRCRDGLNVDSGGLALQAGLPSSGVPAALHRRPSASPQHPGGTQRPPDFAAPNRLAAWRTVLIIMTYHGESKVFGLFFKTLPVTKNTVATVEFSGAPFWITLPA